jgi:hypothetical protein
VAERAVEAALIVAVLAPLALHPGIRLTLVLVQRAAGAAAGRVPRRPAVVAKASDIRARRAARRRVAVT